MDSAAENDAKETAAIYQAAAALGEIESGNMQQARASAIAAMKLAPNRDVHYLAAIVLARAGDSAAAEKLALELEKSSPLDTLVQRYWLPSIRAALALNRKEPDRAVELLKVASATELSMDSLTSVPVFLCPVYLRGEAYLMLRDGSRAAAEFQKFVDHRGLVGNFPWGAMARIGLARSYALQGDNGKARTAYEEFLALWKDADPDVPLLKQARSEYAKLK
jgi:predicted Zn-dependent protease